MSSTSDKILELENPKVNTRIKLSAMWASVMLCLIYGDILGFFVPDMLNEIIAGNMGFLGATTQELMLAGAIFMSIPCIMVYLPLVLKPSLNRWLNIILAVVYTMVMLATMIFMTSWAYYFYLGTIEVFLTIMIGFVAWKWPATFTAE